MLPPHGAETAQGTAKMEVSRSRSIAIAGLGSRSSFPLHLESQPLQDMVFSGFDKCSLHTWSLSGSCMVVVSY